MPVTAALAQYMGPPLQTESRDGIEADLQTAAVRRLFRCPSQTAELWGWTQRGDPPNGSWQSPLESSSYVFNERSWAVAAARKPDFSPQARYLERPRTRKSSLPWVA